MGLQDRDYYWEHHDRVQRGSPGRGRSRSNRPNGRDQHSHSSPWPALVLIVVFLLIGAGGNWFFNHPEVWSSWSSWISSP